MNDDAALLRDYAENGNQVAFEELVGRHLNLVYSAALRRTNGNAHLAADVSQVVFTTLARRARELVHHRTLPAWLYTVTKNAAISLIRGEDRRRQRERAAHDLHDAMNAPTHDAEWQRLRPVLDGIIDTLSDGDRAVVLLRYFEKRSFAEIGKALQVTDNAARVRADRALDRLRALLEKRGITSTTAALAAVLTAQTVAAAPVGLATAISASALAGAAAGTSVTAGFVLLNLMTATKTTLVLGSLGALAAATAVYQANETSRADDRLAAATHQRQAIETQIKDLESRAAATERSQKELQAALASMPVPAAPREPATPRAAGPATPAADPQDALQRLLKSDPAFRDTYIRGMRAHLDMHHAPLYRALKLQPDQIAVFKNILAERFGEEINNPTGVGNNFDASTDARLLSAIRNRLGEPVAQAFIRFEEASGARDLAQQWIGRAYYTDTPFSQEQAEQLTQIVALASPSYRDGGKWKRGDLDWQFIRKEIGAQLPSEQKAAVQSALALQQVELQLQEAANSAKKQQAGEKGKSS